MLWQWIFVGIIVLLALAYLVRAAWKTWRAPSGCGGGCNCKAAKSPAANSGVTYIPAEQLGILRRR